MATKIGLESWVDNLYNLLTTGLLLDVLFLRNVHAHSLPLEVGEHTWLPRLTNAYDLQIYQR